MLKGSDAELGRMPELLSALTDHCCECSLRGTPGLSAAGHQAASSCDRWTRNCPACQMTVASRSKEVAQLGCKLRLFRSPQAEATPNNLWYCREVAVHVRCL
eukprot:jgi/Botrbrau1/10921/Bobra.0025s0094.1